MKNNVIWVDFNPKQKKKGRIKKIISKISEWFKNIFHIRNRSYNPQPLDHFHKSIL